MRTGSGQTVAKGQSDDLGGREQGVEALELVARSEGGLELEFVQIELLARRPVQIFLDARVEALVRRVCVCNPCQRER